MSIEGTKIDETYAENKREFKKKHIKQVKQRITRTHKFLLLIKHANGDKKNEEKVISNVEKSCELEINNLYFSSSLTHIRSRA